MNSRIKIGVLGCANIAQRAVIPAIINSPRLELSGVASRDPKKAQTFSTLFNCKAYGSYLDLLNDDDIAAIYLPLPTGLHYEWISKALLSGKHVLAEKSFANNLRDTRALADTARRLGLVVKENFMFEYHKQQAEVRDLIADELGTIQLFRASFGFPPLNDDNFRYKKELGGGALLDAGGYVLKAMSVFFPHSDIAIKSALVNFDKMRGVDVGGAIFAQIRTNDGVIPAQLAYGFNHVYQCGVDIWGSTNRLITNRTFTAGKDFVPKAELVSDRGVHEVFLSYDDHFQKLLTEFATSIENAEIEKEASAVVEQARLLQCVTDLYE